MLFVNESAHQRLALIQYHRRVWKAFYAAQLEAKRALLQRHRQERNRLHVHKLNLNELAALIFRQTSEIMEFRLIHEDQKQRLKEQQKQQRSSLEAAL